MSEKHTKELRLMPPDLDNLETDIKTWVREFGDGIKTAITAEINGVKQLLEVYMKSNDSEHKTLREEIMHFRDNDREIYNKINKLTDETDKKITTVRVDLQTKIDVLNDNIEEVKTEPAKKAQQLMQEIGKYILILVVGAAFTALVFWLKEGAPK